MNPTLGLRHLAWKEYRAQRSLWLSVLVLAIVVQVCIAVVARLTNSEPMPVGAFAAMGLVAVAVYLLGFGAMSFAIEHELGTFDFQRLLPVATWKMFAVKVGTGLVGGLTMAAILMLFEHAFFIGWTSVLSTSDWFATTITFLEVFLWSLLFSLLLHRPLHAAVAGIIAMTVTVCMIMPYFFHVQWDQDVLLYHRSFLPARVCEVILLFAADILLGWQWFAGRLEWPSTWLRWRSFSTTEVTWPIGATIPQYHPATNIGWSRLVRLAWRQGRVLFVLLVAFFLFFLVRAYGDPFRASHHYGLQGTVLLGAAFVFGLCTFTFDQWGYQFRYFAEHGIRPGWIWLSRQVVWFSPIILGIIAVQMLAVRVSRSNGSPADVFVNQNGFAIAAVIVFATAQFVAMFVRSTLVAIVVTFFLSMIAWTWTMFMITLSVPLWWSVLPIPVIAFFATWFFAKHWIEERQDRSFSRRLAAMIAIPAALIFSGFAAYRVVEIPKVNPGFSVEDYTRPRTASEQATLDLYRQAVELTVSQGQIYMQAIQGRDGTVPELEALWLETQRPALKPIEDAHRRPTIEISAGDMTIHGSKLSAAQNWVTLPYLVRLQAESLTNQGELGEAWHWFEIALELNRRILPRTEPFVAQASHGQEKALLAALVQWANHPQQTEDRIQTALAELAAYNTFLSTPDHAAKLSHVNWSQHLSGVRGGPTHLEVLLPDRWLLRLMPWEMARNQRFLNLLTLSQLDPVAADRVLDEAGEKDLSNWKRTTFFPHHSVASTPPYEIELYSWRAATPILMAAIQWRREKGALPKLLVDLNLKLSGVPLDPASGQSFGWFPDGFDRDLKYQSPRGEQTLVAGTPFLWSAGNTRAQLQKGPNGLRVLAGGYERPLAETLALGIIWPVPEAPKKNSQED